jgi:hypothetical protein
MYYLYYYIFCHSFAPVIEMDGHELAAYKGGIYMIMLFFLENMQVLSVQCY